MGANSPCFGNQFQQQLIDFHNVYNYNMELTPEQSKKVSSFEWKDEAESDTNQTEFDSCNTILECVDKIAQYVIDNIELKDLQQNVCVVNIPIETHPLLEARYDKSLSEYSRSRVFDVLRAVFIQKMPELGYVQQIERKIHENILSDLNVHVAMIDFYDEPEVDVTVTEREINTCSGEENVLQTRAYNYSGNTVTVEIQIEHTL